MSYESEWKILIWKIGIRFIWSYGGTTLEKLTRFVADDVGLKLFQFLFHVFNLSSLISLQLGFVSIVLTGCAGVTPYSLRTGSTE